MSKLRASTLPCAFSSALLTHGWMIASPSFMPEPAEHGVEPVGAEDAHQVVLEDEVELGAARVALAAGAAAQLVVDAPALVALGGEHVEAAGASTLALASAISASTRARSAAGSSVLALLLGGLQLLHHPHLDVAAELDVGAAAGHVGGDGHRAGHAGVGDDLRLLLVVAGVQHVVRDLRRLQHLRRASPTSRSRWCRPGSAGRPRARARSRRRSPRTSRGRCGTPGRRGPRGSPACWSAPRPRRACRSRRTRRPRWRRCRSCRRASRRGGSSSGR